MNIEKRNEVIEELKTKYETIERALNIILAKSSLSLQSYSQIGQGFTNIVYELQTNEGKVVILKLGHPYWPRKIENEIASIELIRSALPHFPLPSLISFDYLCQTLPPFNYILMEKAEGVTFSRYIELYRPSPRHISLILRELARSLSLLSSLQSNRIGSLYFADSPPPSPSPPLAPISDSTLSLDDNLLRDRNEVEECEKMERGKFWRVNERGERDKLEDLNEKFLVGPLPESTHGVYSSTSQYLILTCRYYSQFILSSPKYSPSFTPFLQPLNRFYHHVKTLFPPGGPFFFCHNDVLPDNILLFPPDQLHFYGDRCDDEGDENEDDWEEDEWDEERDDRRKRRISAIIDYEWSLFIAYDVVFSSIDFEERFRRLIGDQIKRSPHCPPAHKHFIHPPHYNISKNGSSVGFEEREDKRNEFAVVEGLLGWAKSEFWFAHDTALQEEHFLHSKSLLQSSLTSLGCW